MRKIISAYNSSPVSFYFIDVSEPSHINITRSIFRLTTSQNRHSSHLRRESFLIPLLLYTKHTQKSTGKNIFFVTFFCKCTSARNKCLPLGHFAMRGVGSPVTVIICRFGEKCNVFSVKKIVKYLLQAVYLFLIYDDIVRSSASIFSAPPHRDRVTAPQYLSQVSAAAPRPCDRAAIFSAFCTVFSTDFVCHFVCPTLFFACFSSRLCDITSRTVLLRAVNHCPPKIPIFQ